MKKILVVEDDRAIRLLISELMKTAGYDVDSAKDGVEGLEKIRKKKYDLVLLDVWMPRMNGLEVLAKLRPETSRPRVIVMTADNTPETLLTAVREQAYQYVSKPFQPKALQELVKKALSTKPSGATIEVVSARPDWVELLVPCELDAADRIQGFLAHLEVDLSTEVRETVGRAFHELLVNAIEWGGKLDPNRKVRISYLRARRMLLYRIADPGQGFRLEDLTHAAVNNPVDQPFEHIRVREDKGLRAGGFGILLTRAMVDELLYNEARNEVVFVKYLD
ncbi:MAG TPA: response regulator [Terriglobia bacterium]|nr:response regulator [Terriglobia bacterium]